MIYVLACRCGFNDEVFAHSSALDDEGRLPCPKCGTMANQDYAAKRFISRVKDNPNPPLEGITKHTIPTHYFDPRDAPGIAALMGDEAKYIQPNGTVQCKTKGEFKAFSRKFNQLRARSLEKQSKKKSSISDEKHHSS